MSSSDRKKNMSSLQESQNHATHNKPAASPQVEKEILRALQDLAYGSVEIVVHDGRVVQIERKEKVRFN